MIPAHDSAAVQAFFTLGFGQEEVHAVRETTADEAQAPRARVEIRRAGPDDLDLVLALGDVLSRHQATPPTYAVSLPEWLAGLRAAYRSVLDDRSTSTLLALRAGRPVGLVLLQIDPPDAVDPLRPVGDIALEVAVTAAEERGTGVGRVLTGAALATARDLGASVCSTDWRSANLSASRFWPRRGFRPVALRLARHVDERIAWADGGRPADGGR